MQRHNHLQVSARRGRRDSAQRLAATDSERHNQPVRSDDVFNVAQTALFWQLLLNKTPALKGV